jgi:hypothetical protein
LDAHAATRSVLTTETQDELDDPVGKRRMTWTAPASPLALGHLAMPEQKRLRRDEEEPPATPWEQRRHGGEDRPISPAVTHTPVYLVLEDAHFVVEHHQFDVLVELISAGRAADRG